MDYLNLNQDKVKETAKALNLLLADYELYYQKIRNFHWNIIGVNFFDLHIQFEDMYGDAAEKIDAIAERILTLGYQPLSNFSDYLETADIKESSSAIEDREMVQILLADHATLLDQMRKVAQTAEDAGDNGSEDLMDGYIGELEKTSWMLQAWSRKKDEHYQKA